MAANPFKAFIPYVVQSAVQPLHAQSYVSYDPSGGFWRTVGLVPPFKKEWHLHAALEGTTTRLMAVQFNERILPGKVRDEHLAKAMTKLEAAEGRKINKKEYVELRTQVEFDLLPKAFIRRTIVYVAFINGAILNVELMLVFTSSQKKADDAVELMNKVFGHWLHPWQVQPSKPLVGIGREGILNVLAQDELCDIELCDMDADKGFYPDDSAVLKGTDKKTIRIKDKAIGEHDVQALLKQDYRVHEIGATYGDDEDNPEMLLVVNGNCAFKSIVVPGIKATGLKDDFFAFALIYVKSCRNMLVDFLQACGGMAKMPEIASSIDDENDEL